MEKIVFLDRATIAPYINMPKPAIAHEWCEYAHSTPEQVLERLKRASIVINNKVALRAETLQQLPQLRLIALTATGYDCVDVEYCRAHGIAVTNVQGYAVNTVPEHAFALILALRRNILAYHQDVQNGAWQQSGQFCFFSHPIRDLAGSTLTLIGSGSIGQKMKHLAEAFGMHVLLAERKGRADIRPGYTAWENALQQADVISVHCPLTPETRHLLDAEAFTLMARNPLLVNTARGNIVDEAALEQALRSGQIAGAGFDVAAREPAPDNSVLVRLTALPNFILTPHIGWASTEAQQVLVRQVAGNIEAFVAGEKRNRVV